MEKKYILIGAVIIALIYYQMNNKQDDPLEEVVSIVEEEYVYVDIKGEITSPGVYMVNYGTRLYELIELAGGVTSNADISSLNLSKIVEDETAVTIKQFEDKSHNFISINTADQIMLMTLPNLGEAKANAIIKYRDANGPFVNTEDIMLVPGIGESIYESIKDFISI
ncbi:ComEA family DNA-binding protein [Mycoplasmatota bacterium]|nr:ComEA family DNA-binding protein [Mycoplasmatota bacterium]